MAEVALKKLDEQLNCSICLDTYVDPKILQCFHVFCRQCLVPLVARNEQGKLGTVCPTCRQVTPVPDRGVTGLQSAFHINRFLEIQDSLQSAPGTPAEWEEKRITLDVNVPPRRKVQSCPEHIEEEVKLYCETCEELICYKCALKCGKHHDHDYEELMKAFEKYTDEITSLLEPMEKKVNTAKESLALLETHCTDISKQKSVIEDDIHTKFNHIREVLTVRENELISQLD